LQARAWSGGRRHSRDKRPNRQPAPR
jgi:hypothetical protein